MQPLRLDKQDSLPGLVSARLLRIQTLLNLLLCLWQSTLFGHCFPTGAWCLLSMENTMSLTKKIVVLLLVLVVPFGIPLAMAFAASQRAKRRAA